MTLMRQSEQSFFAWVDFQIITIMEQTGKHGIFIIPCAFDEKQKPPDWQKGRTGKMRDAGFVMIAGAWNGLGRT
ncbi:hypothetical protein [Paracoccus sp. (in: a-proteobacteria)]|uniref:hypothetical protein n=1 Tax=Paracoccus sp. TaxID=267 RepID=UPI003A881074